jgi:hypothetical protein
MLLFKTILNETEILSFIEQCSDNTNNCYNYSHRTHYTPQPPSTTRYSNTAFVTSHNHCYLLHCLPTTKVTLQSPQTILKYVTITGEIRHVLKWDTRVGTWLYCVQCRHVTVLRTGCNTIVKESDWQHNTKFYNFPSKYSYDTTKVKVSSPYNRRWRSRGAVEV